MLPRQRKELRAKTPGALRDILCPVEVGSTHAFSFLLFLVAGGDGIEQRLSLGSLS